MQTLEGLLGRFRPREAPLETIPAEGQTGGFYNIFEDRDRLREEAFWMMPGAVRRNLMSSGTSQHPNYVVDTDVLPIDLEQCRAITEWYVDKLTNIDHEHRTDLLGFIEKQDGSTGAIQFAGLIAMKTNRPFVAVRLDKDIPEQRIKVPLPKWLPSDIEIPEASKLKGRNVAIVTDTVTDGEDVLAAVSEITNRGGKVTDIVTYVLSSERFKDAGMKLEAQGIQTTYAYEADEVIADAIKHNAIA